MTFNEPNQVHAAIAWTIPSILKGIRHCQQHWNVYSPTSEPFGSILTTVEGCQIVPNAQRGVTLALESNEPSIVFVPNRQLVPVIALAKQAKVAAPLIFVIEDHPSLAPQLSPRETASRAGICVIEPCDASEVEHCAASASWISASCHEPVVLITHHSLLGSASSQVSDISTEQFSLRKTEQVTPLRLGRRYELNRQRTIPSPGERVPVGFITIGMSDSSLRYLVSELQLLGRVPMLNLRMLSPLDAAPLERLLTRCRHVVVLEPRPGEMEHLVLSVAQKFQREGLEIATIWGAELPPTDPEQPPVKVPVDMLHTSVVARYTQHLLHDIKPSSAIPDRLLDALPSLNVSSKRRTTFGTRAALQFLREESENVLLEEDDVGELIIDGKHVKEGEGQSIKVEAWGQDHFLASGLGVVESSSKIPETRLLLVWRSKSIGHSLYSMVESVLPKSADDAYPVIECTIDNIEDFHSAIQNSCKRNSLTVIIVSDGAEPRFDIKQLTTNASEIDKRGFRPHHAIVISAEEMASIRMESASDPSQSTVKALPLETSVATKWMNKQFRHWRFSIKPLLERVEVTRTRPPARVIGDASLRLSPPKPLHSQEPKWRIHIAGTRGDQPGVVGEILLNAGERMGYEVRSQCNSAFVGAGRRAWTQVLFTRKQTTRSSKPLVGLIPWGEANVLLGWDRDETLRAIDPRGKLNIGSPNKTIAIVNVDSLEQQAPLTDRSGFPAMIDETTLMHACKLPESVIKGFASLSRYTFHNERLGDVVQLGMAYQMGLIPVTLDAIQVAVEEVEKTGFARCAEAFEFGRRVAHDSEDAWIPVREEQQEDLERLIRRSIHVFGRRTRKKVKLSGITEQLIAQARNQMPDLETIDGASHAILDVVTGIRRCVLWGGEEVGSLYVNTLNKLYLSDSKVTKRMLTRRAILPLAEAILVRDPIYLAKLSRSPEIRKKIHTMLNIRHSRGDEIARRYLTRIRLQIWNWSLRVDVRSSDWSAVVVSFFDSVIPLKWRGSVQDQKLRTLLLDAAVEASSTPSAYDDWQNRFAVLQKHALNGTLHHLTEEELTTILQSKA